MNIIKQINRRLYACKQRTLCLCLLTFCVVTIIHYNINLIKQTVQHRTKSLRLLSYTTVSDELESNDDFVQLVDIVLNEPKLNRQQNKINSYSYDYWFQSQHVPRGYTVKKHKLIMDLVEILDETFKRHDVKYMLSDGSVVGSWRHHDIVPWDDDMDVLADTNDKPKILNLLDILKSSGIESKRRWDPKKKFEYYKVFFKNSSHAGRYIWKWPFLDILFYKENKTHIFYEKNFEIKKEFIFPLRNRPFGRLFMPTPNNPIEYLNSIKIHNINDLCVRSSWSHHHERTQQRIAIKCKYLENVYPFVKRDCYSGLCQEQLQIGTLKLQKFIFHNKTR